MAKSSSKPGVKADVKSLKKLLANWGKTEARTGGLVPDAVYEAEIVAAEGKVYNDKPKVHYEFKITDGRYEGKSVHKFENLATEKNLEFLKGDLSTMDQELPDEVEDLDELDKIVKETVGLSVEIRVKTTSGEKGDFTNVYINQLLEGGTAGDADDDDDDKDEKEDKKKKSDDDDDDDDDASDGPEVGNNVSFEDDDGKEWSGELIKIKGDRAVVKVGKKKMKVDLDELSVEDDDD